MYSKIYHKQQHQQKKYIYIREINILYRKDIVYDYIILFIPDVCGISGLRSV